MEKLPQMAPNGAGRIFFPTNPDLADILGRTDLDLEKFLFFIFWIPNFWISRSPDFQNLAPGQAWEWPGQARRCLMMVRIHGALELLQELQSVKPALSGKVMTPAHHPKPGE